jgi:peroxiredoxin
VPRMENKAVRFLRVISIVIVLCIHGRPVWAQSQAMPEIAIGHPAPIFSVTDENGVRRRLSDYRGSIVVLEWLDRNCPFVKKHYESNNMQALQNDARARGVVWLTVSSTAPSHPGYMDGGGAQRFRNRYLAEPTTILLDPDGRMGRQYDVEVAPQVFIIDADGILVYMGGMDDKVSTRIADIDQATDYVGDALDAVIAGQTVSHPITRAYGCPIVY